MKQKPVLILREQRHTDDPAAIRAAIWQAVTPWLRTALTASFSQHEEVHPCAAPSTHA